MIGLCCWSWLCRRRWRVCLFNTSRPPTPSALPAVVYKPLIRQHRADVRSRPLGLAVIGIAFFTFIVAFMRSTVYMHGECQRPRWNEFIRA